jgi:DNA-binding response OmpR family regulator
MQSGVVDRSEAQSGGRKLLFVEDEISTVFAMREYFSFNGYIVDCAASVTDAMVLLDQSSYDVVITDLHLTPHRCAEGMTVVSRARRLNPAALIVMLTAYGSDESEQEAARSGVNLFETKPVGLAKLASMIEARRTNQTPEGESASGDCAWRK